MTQNYVLRDLLHQDEEMYPNSLLLKKFLLCVYYGWFKINGCLPDKSFTLSDYLFDKERIVFDFTRLSEHHREQFNNWFINPHKHNAYRAFLSNVTTNDKKGYTTEVGLSWWDSITNYLYYRKKSYVWSLSSATVMPNYPLNNIEICEGEGGLLLGLNHLSLQFHDNKYHKPEDSQDVLLRNTKRLLLTDKLVEKLISTSIQSQNYDDIIDTAHPYSIDVDSIDKRMEAMNDYRSTQQLTTTKSWYSYFWEKFFSPANPANNDVEMQDLAKSNNKNLQLLIRKDFVQVYKRVNNDEIVIIEKRPEIDTMVFCGGGAKIFGHVGAYKAFQDAQIKATKFTGSSSGAIMATLCYLGYSFEEILHFFQRFRQEILIYFDVGFSGLSDTAALKAALDYMITKKVNQIIKDYNIEETPEGRDFLANSVFVTGKITFASLHKLKARYPDCGLGDELVITATNIEQQHTSYFSFETIPTMELSEATTTSASLPVVFKPTILEGEAHNDGGVLNNLPTNVYRDNRSTLLESIHGNLLSMVVFQFDNGIEREMLDTVVHQVYRENFVLDWIYGFLTGVKNPVSGWERDRLKLIQYSNQVVLIPVNNVSATQFDMDKKTQEMLFENGYQAAKNYITARYEQEDECSKAINEEYLYSNFSSLEEVLFYCCYRDRHDWFDLLTDIAVKQGVDIEVINQLKRDHFQKSESMENKEFVSFSSKISHVAEEAALLNKMRLFNSIYPIFLKIPTDFATSRYDMKLFKAARHAVSLSNPLKCLDSLQLITGKTHILLAVLTRILQDFSSSKTELEVTCTKLDQLASMIFLQDISHQPNYYGYWELKESHVNTILTHLEKGDWEQIKAVCDSLNHKVEAIQMADIQVDLKSDTEEKNPVVGFQETYRL